MYRRIPLLKLIISLAPLLKEAKNYISQSNILQLMKAW